MKEWIARINWYGQIGYYPTMEDNDMGTIYDTELQNKLVEPTYWERMWETNL